MFTNLTLRGTTASILYGARTAVLLRGWSMAKQQGKWKLTATIEHLDAFQARQRPLLFTAPRGAKGFWVFPVEALDLTPRQLTATLGAPEQ